MAENPFEDIVLVRSNIAKVEVRSLNQVVTVIFYSSNPNSQSPSIWIDIDVLNKRLAFYKDIGSGWALVGFVYIT